MYIYLYIVYSISVYKYDVYSPLRTLINNTHPFLSGKLSAIASMGEFAYWVFSEHADQPGLPAGGQPFRIHGVLPGFTLVLIGSRNPAKHGEPLVLVPSGTFHGAIQDQTEASRGNVNVQISKLEEAGYLKVEKSVNKKPLTTMEITPKGLNAMDTYTLALKDYLICNL